MSIKTNERPQQAAAIGSAEHNRIVASQWIDAFNARDDAAEADARTADYIAHAPDSIQSAPLDSDAWFEFLGGFLKGFPDLHLEVLGASADEGMTAQRILFTGTHTGPFRGLPPTGRKVRFSGLEINRMVDGRVAEHWFQLDAVTLFEQLGLHIVPGPRLLPRLLAWPVTRLLGKRRRTVSS
jgi:predicted ester cyclase